MRFLVPQLSYDPELRAIQIRLARKRRLNHAAHAAFCVLTLGMCPQYRFRLFRLDDDLNAKSAVSVRVRRDAILRREIAAKASNCATCGERQKEQPKRQVDAETNRGDVSQARRPRIGGVKLDSEPAANLMRPPLVGGEIFLQEIGKLCRQLAGLFGMKKDEDLISPFVVLREGDAANIVEEHCQASPGKNGNVVEVIGGSRVRHVLTLNMTFEGGKLKSAGLSEDGREIWFSLLPAHEPRP